MKNTIKMQSCEPSLNVLNNLYRTVITHIKHWGLNNKSEKYALMFYMQPRQVFTAMHGYERNTKMQGCFGQVCI